MSMDSAQLGEAAASDDAREANIETYLSLSRFLYREARLLDEERYRDWLALMDADIEYWAPGLQCRFRSDKGPHISTRRMAHFDERYKDLELRVRRFESPMAWAEDPPTRLCHVVSNIEVHETDDPAAFIVRSVVTLHRNRNETEETMMVGRRQDLIRRRADGWRLARRTILLIQTVLLHKNINTFL